jgi:hypothetical protein
MFQRQQEDSTIMKETLSKESVPRNYKQDQLAARQPLGFSRELLLLKADS